MLITRLHSPLLDNDPSSQYTPYFAGMMALWSCLFLEFWKRKEKDLALRWGTIGFEENEQPRPQFEGENRLSPIHGHPTKYFSPDERFRRSLKSHFSIFTFLGVIVGILAAIFVIRVLLQTNSVSNSRGAGIAAALLISGQIFFMNYLFGDIAIRLNNHENHRTDTEYEDALISKTFLFQFFNSYTSLFYISFMQPFTNFDPCQSGNCFVDVQTTLGTIFITRLVAGNIVELGAPLYHSFMKTRASKEALLHVSGHMSVGDGKHELSEVERTFNLEEYDVLMGTFEDYSEMVIQFGYMTLFICAFPLGTVLAFINNYVELRVDAWKLCQLCRRPSPRSAEDIGTWQTVLTIMAVAAVFTNSALVAFTGKFTDNDQWTYRVWIFVLMSGGLLR